MNEERLYWLCFSVFPGIGAVKFNELLKHFSSAKAAWEALGTPLSRPGTPWGIFDLAKLIGEKTAEKFVDFRKKFSVLEYAEKLQKKKVSFLILTDPEYPSLLKQTTKPPFVLYAKGDLSSIIYSSSEQSESRSVPLSSRAHSINSVRGDLPEKKIAASQAPRNDIPSIISVVGTRKITQYGRDVTRLITSELVAQGFTIVSGLAMGVDAVAHQTAIDNGGRTIAVLGCGVDCCTPEENLNLYDEILEKGGCIISELPLGHPPNKGSFPARNRIVAGLSLGTIVTEGAEDSGALITAGFALKFNRKVFAVPGPITSTLSKGPYKLIQKGAKLVTSGKDIISELGITGTTHSASSGRASTTSITGKKKQKGGTKEEEKILEILENEPLTFDEIVRKSKMPSSQVGSILSMMEVKGIIKSLDNSYFTPVL